VIHDTVGPPTGDYPSLNAVRDGSGGITGPLANLLVSRSGKWFVIAAGKANHAGETIDDSIYGNSHSIGITAEGVGTPSDDNGHRQWPEGQYASLVKGVKALLKFYPISTDRVKGAKEVSKGSKSDPNFSMNEFRDNLIKKNLAEILREAGLTVIEDPGWETRNHGTLKAVTSIILHHTAGPAFNPKKPPESGSAADYPSLSTVRYGRPDLKGPLCNLGLGFSGTWYTISSGLAWHAGKTIDDTKYSNQYALGIEAEGHGLPATDVGHDHWPEVQYQSYLKGVKALMNYYKVSMDNVKGHKEICMPRGNKIDPNFDMNAFRNDLMAIP